MAVRKIELFGSDVLRERAKEVTRFDDKLQKLLDDMAETMINARGAGLAGNQVGVPFRVVVVDLGALEDREDIRFLINPEIVHKEGKREDDEGCLSFPKIFIKLIRPKKLKIKALDRKGKVFEIEGEDFLSKALGHEIDHLDGILMLDHLSSLKRELLKKKIKKMIKEGEWDDPYPPK